MEIPIWIADYVLMGYGTGAVMGVPAHDERDLEFAEKFKLPVVSVYEEEKAVRSDFLNGLTMHAAKETMIRWLEEHAKGQRTVQYKLRDWLFSRQRYWGEPIPILHLEDGTMRPLGLDELPLMPPPLDDYKPAATGESPLAKVRDWVEVVDPKTGKKAVRPTDTMPQWAGSCWYYLRFCDPHNDREAWSKKAENYWMPVDLYVGGVEHAVLHLLYARFWHKVLYDLKLVHTAEPFLCLRNQGLVIARSYKLPGGGYVHPDEVKEGEEGDLIVQVEKMSKSKLNGVSPDEIILEFGADALRLYEMFMGPFDREKLWSTEAVNGCKRCLNRFYDMVHSEKVSDQPLEEAMKLSHRLVHAVTSDLEVMQFNTAIARMMEFLNAFIPLPRYPREALKRAVQMLYPFAPHLAEELWERLGEKNSITYEPIPPIDPAYLEDPVATYVVQINGKLRGRFELPKNLVESEVMDHARQQPEVAKYLEGEIIKTVYIPNKLLNIVIK